MQVTAACGSCRSPSPPNPVQLRQWKVFSWGSVHLPSPWMFQKESGWRSDVDLFTLMFFFSSLLCTAVFAINIFCHLNGKNGKTIFLPCWWLTVATLFSILLSKTDHILIRPDAALWIFFTLGWSDGFRNWISFQFGPVCFSCCSHMADYWSCLCRPCLG